MQGVVTCEKLMKRNKKGARKQKQLTVRMLPFLLLSGLMSFNFSLRDVSSSHALIQNLSVLPELQSS